MNAQQLRNSILQEAIEGRLVPQDPNDEPASVLLERIREEKKRLVKEGKLKKKDLEEKPISEDEKPFEIPDSWEWCRINDIIFPPKYGTSNKSLPQGDVPVLRMGNIQNGEIVFDKLVYSNSQTDNEKYNLIAGDLLFNRTNSAELVGKTGVYRGQRKAIFAGYLILLRPINIYSDYLNSVLGSSYARSYCKEVKTIGVQQCNINAEKISTFVIPLPPLAEQKRIVAKIEELLPKVEEYGKAQDALDKLNKELPERLKKSILQEAISGRLVPQDPNDEPASVLLDKIRKEKAQLVKEGKLKKKDLIDPPITDDEKPFDIPDSWEWVRLSGIALDSADGPFGSNLKSEHYTNRKEVRIIQLSNIGELGWKDTNSKYTTYEHLETISRSEAYPRDVIIAKMMPAGRAIICPSDDPKYVLSSDAVRFNFDKRINRKFLYYAINSPVFINQVYSEVQGITRVRTSLTKLRYYLIPLPPLAEQKRIVAKIEQLFGEIDKLKKVGQ